VPGGRTDALGYVVALAPHAASASAPAASKTAVSFTETSSAQSAANLEALRRGSTSMVREFACSAERESYCADSNRRWTSSHQRFAVDEGT